MILKHPPDDALLKQTPWLVEVERFSTVNDRERIISSLNELRSKKTFVSLSVSEKGGDLFFDSFILAVDQRGIRFYRSPKWPEKEVERFQVYFKNDAGTWHLMNGQVIYEDTHSLLTSEPDTLQILRQRSCRRLEAPRSTRATLFYGKNNKSSFQVLNISHTGVLLCGGTAGREKLPLMSGVCNINIGLSEGGALPVVREGQVVRTFQNNSNGPVCYGIIFKDNGEVDEEKIWEFISGAEDC